MVFKLMFWIFLTTGLVLAEYYEDSTMSDDFSQPDENNQDEFDEAPVSTTSRPSPIQFSRRRQSNRIRTNGNNGINGNNGNNGGYAITKSADVVI